MRNMESGGIAEGGREGGVAEVLRHNRVTAEYVGVSCHRIARASIFPGNQHSYCHRRHSKILDEGDG